MDAARRSADDLFLERIKRERVEQGLPPTITDPSVLRLVAAVVARRGGDRRAAA